jgi:hypothetical protein
MHTQHNYWSCTKLADKIRGTDNPGAATSKEWKNWKKAAKDKHPFRFWVAETVLDNIQDVINYPADKFYDAKHYFRNRFISHSHQLTAHPDHLKKGQWCDITDRILPCLFDTLVDFIEIEKAHMQSWNDEVEKYKWKNGRCKEAGIDHLIWEESLIWDENSGVYPEDKNYGKTTFQAIAAKEIHELYNWWTELYPNRPEAMDESGWSAWCDRKRSNGDDMLCEDETPAERKESKRILNKLNKLEKQYTDEDTAMMIRLIKIRENLWT